jgi:TRAP-type C4-dicarboxylate transport system permease small subunit
MSSAPPTASRPHWRIVVTIGAVVAGAALLGLAAVTMAEVVARAFGYTLVSGVIELSNMTVLFLGFFGLPYCFLVGGHITVDIATQNTPDSFNRALDRLWNIVAGLFLLLMAGLVGANGITLQQSGETSATLQWSPLVFHVPAVIGMVLAAVTCLVLGWRGSPGEVHSAD